MRGFKTMTSAAALLLLCSAPYAYAQRGPEGGAGGGGAIEKGGGAGPGQSGSAPGRAEGTPGGKGERANPPAANKSASDRGEATPVQKGKGAEAPAQNKAQKQAEPATKDATTKGAQTQPDRTNRQAQQPAAQGGATTKGAADRTQDRTNQQQAQQPGTTKGAINEKTNTNERVGQSGRNGTSQQAQLSEQQRTSVHQTLLRERNVNRVQNVNIQINVGSRVPNGIRLAALPIAVVNLVPQYRGYQYFVVSDEVCIVEPRTHEIVDVIVSTGGRPGPDRGHQQTAALTLTDNERAIIIQSIDVSASQSTLGLGALEVGAVLPRDVRIEVMPVAVVQQVPKLRGYYFFTAENAVAIVDPGKTRIMAVVEERR